MLCFCQNTEFPEFFIQIFHKGCNAWLDHAKVMIIQLLPFRRLSAKQGSAGKAQIRSFVIHFFGNQEILLLRSHRRNHSFCCIISEQLKNPECLAAEDFHRTKKWCLFIQCVPAIRTECCRNTKGFAFDKCIRCRIPCRITSGFERCPETAVRERRCVRFSFDQFLAGEFHDHAAIRCR